MSDPLIFQIDPNSLDMITCWPMTVSAADKPGDFFVSTVKDYLPYTCLFFLAIKYFNHELEFTSNIFSLDGGVLPQLTAVHNHNQL